MRPISFNERLPIVLSSIAEVCQSTMRSTRTGDTVAELDSSFRRGS